MRLQQLKIIILLLIMPLAAMAKVVYQVTDVEGRTLFSDQPVAGFVTLRTIHVDSAISPARANAAQQRMKNLQQQGDRITKQVIQKRLKQQQLQVKLAASQAAVASAERYLQQALEKQRIYLARCHHGIFEHYTEQVRYVDKDCRARSFDHLRTNLSQAKARLKLDRMRLYYLAE